MTPSRDVIRDLLPLYAAGEASADSARLVEAALAADPALAAEADAFRRADPSAGKAVPPAPDRDRAALSRIRSAVRLRSVLMGFAIFLTLLPFSFFYVDGQVKLFALRDAPGTAIPALLAGVGCWIAYAVVGRRLARGSRS
jgi:anti-sigma factor RsiW